MTQMVEAPHHNMEHRGLLKVSKRPNPSALIQHPYGPLSLSTEMSTKEFPLG